MDQSDALDQSSPTAAELFSLLQNKSLRSTTFLNLTLDGVLNLRLNHEALGAVQVEFGSGCWDVWIVGRVATGAIRHALPPRATLTAEAVHAELERVLVRAAHMMPEDANARRFVDMVENPPTWEPLRALLAARLPDCTVTLDKPRTLRVAVPYSDAGEVVLHLGEPWAADRITPKIVDERVSHIFCVGFEATYSYDRWPPERLQSLMGGPFEEYARATARHFAEILDGTSARVRRFATNFVEVVSSQVNAGERLPIALELALRNEVGEHARADELLARARAYRALAETPHPSPLGPTSC